MYAGTFLVLFTASRLSLCNLFAHTLCNAQLENLSLEATNYETHRVEALEATSRLEYLKDQLGESVHPGIMIPLQYRYLDTSSIRSSRSIELIPLRY